MWFSVSHSYRHVLGILAGSFLRDQGYNKKERAIYRRGREVGMEYPSSTLSEPAKLVRRLWRIFIGLFLGQKVSRTKETLEYSNKTSKIYSSTTIKWKQQGLMIIFSILNSTSWEKPIPPNTLQNREARSCSIMEQRRPKRFVAQEISFVTCRLGSLS